MQKIFPIPKTLKYDIKCFEILFEIKFYKNVFFFVSKILIVTFYAIFSS